MKVFGIWFCFEFFVNAEQPNTPILSVGRMGVGCFFSSVIRLENKKNAFCVLTFSPNRLTLILCPNIDLRSFLFFLSPFLFFFYFNPSIILFIQYIDLTAC